MGGHTTASKEPRGNSKIQLLGETETNCIHNQSNEQKGIITDRVNIITEKGQLQEQTLDKKVSSLH